MVQLLCSIMLFVLLSSIFFVKLTSGFRLELEEPASALFHIETEAGSCGCEEQSRLDLLKHKTWTPQDFTTHQRQLWLGGIKAQSFELCDKMCLLINRRTTHFTFEDSSMCHCYSDLHPFHCEEEEGVKLVQISCLWQKKVPNSRRPLLTMLSNRPKSTPKSYYKNEEDNKLKLKDEQKTTLAAASGVLILMALIGLAGLIAKTFHEEKRKKKSSNAGPVVASAASLHSSSSTTT